MYVDLHLHCQGRAWCTGNRRLHVLKSDKCAVAMTYWPEPQLWLLGRQVLLFREQRWIVLLVKEKNRMVHAGSHKWGDLSSHLAPACVCWVPGPLREGVDQSPVLVTVWECKLLGFCRYLFRYCYDFKCRENPANAESGNQCAKAKKRILTGICFVV